MTESSDTNSSAIAHRRARIFRWVAMVSLALGLSAAGLVYWHGRTIEDLSNDPPMLGFDRASTQETEVLYGKPGLLFAGWLNDLKKPRTQCSTIIIVTILVAAVCLKIACLCDRDAELD